MNTIVNFAATSVTEKVCYSQSQLVLNKYGTEFVVVCHRPQRRYWSRTQAAQLCSFQRDIYIYIKIFSVKMNMGYHHTPSRSVNHLEIRCTAVTFHHTLAAPILHKIWSHPTPSPVPLALKYPYQVLVFPEQYSREISVHLDQ